MMSIFFDQMVTKTFMMVTMVTHANKRADNETWNFFTVSAYIIELMSLHELFTYWKPQAIWLYELFAFYECLYIFRGLGHVILL